MNAEDSKRLLFIALDCLLRIKKQAGNDRRDYDSFSLGYWEYSDFFGKLGMRDFAIYNTQLADSKIETLYNSGVMADYSTLLSDDPTVYYPLQEDGNNVAFGSLPINFTLSNVTFDNI